MPELPTFNNRKLLLNAFTHRSYINENPGAGEDNERLEFLGDAVLGLAVSKVLFERFPYSNEGDLSKKRDKLVNKEQLAKFAEQLDLGNKMRLGIGEQKTGGRKKPSLLCNVLEACIGAYFLDSGFEAVCGFIEQLIEEPLSR